MLDGTSTPRDAALFINKASQKPIPDLINHIPDPNLSNLPEEALLETAIHFDEAALGELYDRYEAKIYSYIYRRVGDKLLTEDMMHQVFLKMFEAIRNKNAWHSSFSGWLYRIAHNLIIDHYRKHDGIVHVSYEDVPEISLIDPENDPVEFTSSKITAEKLRAAISRLTGEQAEVLSLRFLEGYSINEVAEMMNKTEGAVKALQYRGIVTIRPFLTYDTEPVDNHTAVITQPPRTPLPRTEAQERALGTHDFTAYRTRLSQHIRRTYPSLSTTATQSILTAVFQDVKAGNIHRQPGQPILEVLIYAVNQRCRATPLDHTPLPLEHALT